MSNKDSKDYYRTLGVQPDAPASVIKAAYRALAMDLHPDRNPGKDTTAQFQKLQEAYACLSEEKLRQKYDADGVVPSANTPSDDGNRKPLEPIVCSKCSRVSAQPRFKVFYTVYGYILGATKKPHQGVFCSDCEVKVALKSSAITLIAGWWSFIGFFWTLETLVRNLVGGQFNQQDAQLQGYQAMYFAQRGKADLARAIAIEALKIAEKATKENKKQDAFKKNLGYEKVDPLGDLKKTLTDFLSHFPANAKVVELKATNGIFNRRFAYQSLLLLALAGLISGEIYRQERAAVEIERARLERQGIEREKAAAIAAKQAEVLRSMEKPLPESGIFGFVDPDNFNPNESPRLRILNSPDANTLMKLVRVDGGADVISVFIRSGQTVEVKVPVGNYKAKIASGQTWYGDAVRFGPSTSYAVLDAVLEFKKEGSQLLGHELTLTRVYPRICGGWMWSDKPLRSVA